MDRLQAENRSRSQTREIEAANVIVREAGDHRAVAEQAHAARTAFTGLFDRMMAVPIAACP